MPKMGKVTVLVLNVAERTHFVMSIADISLTLISMLQKRQANVIKL
jgi:hypothetical protein